MRSALRHSLAALALALCTAVCGCSAPGGDAAPDGRTRRRVVRVVDGDTIRVGLPSGEEAVRYIGIDTPESVKPGAPVECFAKRASAFNERLVAGERVQARARRRASATASGACSPTSTAPATGCSSTRSWSAAATPPPPLSRPTSPTSASSGGWRGGPDCPDADFGRSALVRAE